MKRNLTLALTLAFLTVLFGCSKTSPKSTGHLYIKVDMTAPVAAYAPTSPTRASGSVFVAGSGTTYNALASCVDSSQSNRSVKTLDLGELNAGEYQGGQIYGSFYDYNYNMWRPFSSSSYTTAVIQIVAGQDKTVTVTL